MQNIYRHYQEFTKIQYFEFAFNEKKRVIYTYLLV